MYICSQEKKIWSTCVYIWNYNSPFKFWSFTGSGNVNFSHRGYQNTTGNVCHPDLNGKHVMCRIVWHLARGLKLKMSLLLLKMIQEFQVCCQISKGFWKCYEGNICLVYRVTCTIFIGGVNFIICAQAFR